MPAVTGSPLRTRLPPALAILAAALLSALPAGCGTTGPAGSPGVSTPPDAVAADGTHTGQTTYRFARAVRAIQLDARGGRVTVAAQNGPVTVAETVTYTDDRPTTARDLVDGVLNLTDGGCRLARPTGGHCEVDWDIHAPAGTTLLLSTRSGGVAVTGPFTDLTVRSDAGPVRGRDLAGREVSVQDGTGQVDLRFIQPPDLLRVVTTSGSVTVRVPAGPSYTVDATAPAGPPDVELTQDGSATHRVQAHSDTGAVRITNG
jgi:predicted small lipoprotein YifL